MVTLTNTNMYRTSFAVKMAILHKLMTVLQSTEFVIV